MGISCSNTTISSRPLLSVDFIHPPGVKTRGGGGGGASAAKETLRSPTAACPDVHPHNRLMAKKALKQREARVEMPACCKEALPK